MSHVIISKKIDEENIIRLEGMEKIIAEKLFKIKEVFIRPDRQAYLLRIVTKDKDYTQKFFILIAQHKAGTIVKIDTGFQPYRTPAVKMVVEEIGHLLQEIWKFLPQILKGDIYSKFQFYSTITVFILQDKIFL